MPYRSTPKVAARKQARRRTLLGAALRLFGARGYHATTVPAIVTEAGSSIGTFYLYFRNKEDIFAAVLQDLAERLAESLDVAIAAESQPLAQMKAAVRQLFLFLAGHPAEARILVIESSGLSSRLEEVRRSIIRSHARGVEATLARVDPDLPRGTIGVFARCWVGAVLESVCYWLEIPAGKRPKPEEVAAVVALFNLRAIGAAPI